MGAIVEQVSPGFADPGGFFETLVALDSDLAILQHTVAEHPEAVNPLLDETLQRLDTEIGERERPFEAVLDRLDTIPGVALVSRRSSSPKLAQKCTASRARAAIPQYLRFGNRRISRVRASHLDRARDAIDLVAATVNTTTGVVTTQSSVKTASMAARRSAGSISPKTSSSLRAVTSICCRPRLSPLLWWQSASHHVTGAGRNATSSGATCRAASPIGIRSGSVSASIALPIAVATSSTLSV